MVVLVVAGGASTPQEHDFTTFNTYTDPIPANSTPLVASCI